MLDDLSGQSIELNLLTATFDQPVIDFCHPLGQRQFGALIKEIGAVQLSVQLIDKICSGQAKLVKQFPKSSPGDMKAVVSASHDVLVQRFWWGSG